jgi:hypothetical protein
MGLVLPIMQDAPGGGTALAINNTGAGDGIKGETQGDGFHGLYGQASSYSGTGHGVHGVSNSSAGTGVYGFATTSVDSDPNYGVFGKTNSASGFGVHGEHFEGHFGRLGGASAGVLGEHTNGNMGTIGGADAAVWGENNGSKNTGQLGTISEGVIGTNGNGNMGHLAHAAYGVLGFATNGNAARFSTLGTTNENAVVSIAGTLHSSSLLQGYLGTIKQFEIDNEGSMSVYNTPGSDLVARLDAADGSASSTFTLYRDGNPVITLDADFSGDSRVITQEMEITGGSDLSEHFDVSSSEDGSVPDEGVVVSIDPENPGRLVVSDLAYDPLVAGVISGAGGVETGLLLRQKGSVADGEWPIALVGRAYVRADANYGMISPGDFLTTSPTPGHAMCASDRERVYGTVLGKAMSSLEDGTGLVLVLLNLQ